MFNIGPQELLLILLVALVIVGPKRLPELSRTIGRGLREFRKAQDEVTKTIRLGLDDAEPTTKPTGRSAVAATKGAEATGEPASEEPGSTAEAAADPSHEPSAAPEPDDAAQIARTLGRGLAEIRRTRQEIQRTFRVDLGTERAPSTRRRTTVPSAPPKPTTRAPSLPAPEAPPVAADGAPTSDPAQDTHAPAPADGAGDGSPPGPGTDG